MSVAREAFGIGYGQPVSRRIILVAREYFGKRGVLIVPESKARRGGIARPYCDESQRGYQVRVAGASGVHRGEIFTGDGYKCLSDLRPFYRGTEETGWIFRSVALERSGMSLNRAEKLTFRSSIPRCDRVSRTGFESWLSTSRRVQ